LDLNIENVNVPFSSKKHGKGDNATFVSHPESLISKLSLSSHLQLAFPLFYVECSLKVAPSLFATLLNFPTILEVLTYRPNYDQKKKKTYGRFFLV